MAISPKLWPWQEELLKSLGEVKEPLQFSRDLGKTMVERNRDPGKAWRPPVDPTDRISREGRAGLKTNYVILDNVDIEDVVRSTLETKHLLASKLLDESAYLRAGSGQKTGRVRRRAKGIENG